MLEPQQDESKNIEWVEKYLDVRSSRGSEYNVLCPIHDDSDPSMDINVEKGVFICRSCGVKGSLKTLAHAIGAPWHGGAVEYSVDVVRRKLQKLKDRQQESYNHSEIELTRYRFPCKYWTDPMPEGRGFSPDIVDLFELGYDFLPNAATIPIRDLNGKYLGITRRFLDADAEKKYKDPKGFSKATVLYGAWQATHDPRDYLVICEGPLDAVAVWQAGHPAVAQFGSSLSVLQRRVLRNLGATTIVLAYDNDKAGEKCTSRTLGFDIDPRTKGTKYNPDEDLRKHHIVKKIDYYKTRSKDPGGMRSDVLNAVVLNALESKIL